MIHFDRLTACSIFQTPGSMRPLIHSFLGAFAAEIFFSKARVRILAEDDDYSALGTLRRLIGRRVGEFFEIVFVGSVPDVNFRLKTAPARSAFLPIAVMLFGVMIGA